MIIQTSWFSCQIRSQTYCNPTIVSQVGHFRFHQTFCQTFRQVANEYNSQKLVIFPIVNDNTGVLYNVLVLYDVRNHNNL